MTFNTSLSIHAGNTLSNGYEYISVVGTLQYCTITQPDISFALNKLCQFMHCLTDVHWHAVKQVLRYLQGTSHFGLSIQASSNYNLCCYTDTDWVSSPDDRHSTTRCCVYMDANLISWASSKQKVVSRSTAESEYQATANGAAELAWIHFVFQELHIGTSYPPTIFTDSTSVVP